MSSNKFKPSSKLLEEYRQAPINNLEFPDFETLNREIGIAEEKYNETKKRYKNSDLRDGK